MASEATSRVSKASAPLFTRANFILLAGLCGTLVGSYFLHGAWRHTHADFQAVFKKSETFEGAVIQLHSAFSSLLTEHLQQERPASPDSRAALAKLAQACEEFVNVQEQSIQPLRAQALRLLGVYYLNESAVAGAEHCCTKALACFADLPKENLGPEAHRAFAEICNHLTYLHAAKGEIAKASKANAEAFARLQQLREPLEPECLRELAVACSNRGLLGLNSGKYVAPEADLRRSCAIFTELFAQSNGEVRLLRSLVDAHQLMGRFFWRTARHGEAEQSCNDALKLLDVLDRSDSQVRAGYHRLIVEQNRQSAQRGTNAAKAPWRWTRVSVFDAKTLTPDLFDSSVLPGEFEPQDALLLAYRNEHAQPFEATTCNLIAAAAPYTPVLVLVPDMHAQNVLTGELLQAKVNMSRIRFCHIRIDTLWTRDYGPFCLRTENNAVRWLNAPYIWQRADDEHVPTALANALYVPVTRSHVHLSGGNILSNGAGVVIATSTLLDRNASLGVSEEQVRAAINRLFGASEIVFLEPLKGELTGDVDWFAAFTSANTVVVGDYGDQDPENAAILNRNADRLARVPSLRVVRIPMPPRGQDFFGGTYTNVVFANRVLLVPTWKYAPADLEERALNTYRKLLPGWQVVGIDTSSAGLQNGGLRCLTMQLRGLPNR